MFVVYEVWNSEFETGSLFDACHWSLLIIIMIIIVGIGDRGGTVVKVLCYKSKGRWFDPSWCHWNFSFT